MLKLLFHRSSIIPKFIELLGLAGMIAIAYDSAIGKMTFPWIVALVFLLYLLLRGCSVKRWYKGVPRDAGIELHFKKIVVPASYLLMLSTGSYLFFQQIWMAWLTIPILLFLVIVNCILIYLHCQDKTETPINYFTRTF